MNGNTKKDIFCKINVFDFYKLVILFHVIYL